MKHKAFVIMCNLHLSLNMYTWNAHADTHAHKLHRHRPQIEKISETLFHAASMRAGLHMTRFLFSSRADVLFLHVCQSKNAIAAIALQECPNVGTLGYHCTELPVPTEWNSCFKPLEPFVTITMNCWFPEIELMLSNLGTVGSPFQTTAISRRWNSRAPT